MQGLGTRLKARARELELTDAEVARRLGISQNRYSNYTNDIVEPDLTTFTQIIRVLGISADEALGLHAMPAAGIRALLQERLAMATEAIEPAILSATAAVMDAAAKILREQGVAGTDSTDGDTRVKLPRKRPKRK